MSVSSRTLLWEPSQPQQVPGPHPLQLPVGMLENGHNPVGLPFEADELTSRSTLPPSASRWSTKATAP